MSSVLLGSLKQAVRSTTLILLPLAFISLVAWATAGSSTGNTADPLRAAIWFYLIAHHIPLDLSISNNSISGALTFFPIGALLIPFLAIKSAYARLTEERDVKTLREKRAVVFSLALTYSFCGTVLSLFATGTTVKSPFYIVFPILFLVASVSGFLASNLLPSHAIQLPWQRALRIAWIATIFLIGFGGLIFTLSLAWHFSTVVQLTRVIEPGVFGGLAFLAVQILYLPNFAVAALSYLAGSGVVIGSGSWLNPFVHRIDEIPAVPLLGALPVRPHPYLALLVVFVIALGALIAKYAQQTYSDPTEAKRFLASTIGFIAFFMLMSARASSGELLSSNLASVGPQWWLLPILLSAEITLGTLLYIGIPLIAKKIQDLRSADAKNL